MSLTVIAKKTKPNISGEWYYAIGGVRHGPVTPSELKRLANSNVIGLEDYVWTTCLKEWVHAKSLKGLYNTAAIHDSNKASLHGFSENDPQNILIQHKRSENNANKNSTVWEDQCNYCGANIYIRDIDFASEKLQIFLGFYFIMSLLNDTSETLLQVLQITSLMLSVIYFFKWIYIANFDIREFGVKGLDHTPNRSIWCYFIPILNFVLPYKNMKQIWKASKNPGNWKKEVVPSQITWWWVLLLIYINRDVVFYLIIYMYPILLFDPGIKGITAYQQDIAYLVKIPLVLITLSLTETITRMQNDLVINPNKVVSQTLPTTASSLQSTNSKTIIASQKHSTDSDFSAKHNLTT